MNRAIAFARLAIVLACYSCGGGTQEDAPQATAVSGDNHGYGWQYDTQGATGLKLRYTPVFKADSALANPAAYEQAFEEVKACTGMKASAPFVIDVKFGDLGLQPNGSPYAGKYFMQPSLIVVSGFAGSDIIFYYRHELIHHLLFSTTGDPDQNHASPLFSKCV